MRNGKLTILAKNIWNYISEYFKNIFKIAVGQYRIIYICLIKMILNLVTNVYVFSIFSIRR